MRTCSLLQTGLLMVLMALFAGCGGDEGVELMDPDEAASEEAETVEEPSEEEAPADTGPAPGEVRLLSKEAIPLRENIFRTWDFTLGLKAVSDVQWPPSVTALEMSGVVEYQVRGPGPGPVMPVVNAPADRIQEIRFSLKTELSQGLKRTPVTPRTVRVLWVRDTDGGDPKWPFVDERILDMVPVAEDQPGVYAVRPGVHPLWNGTIQQLAFDLFLAPGPASAENAFYAVRPGKIELVEFAVDPAGS